MLTSTPRSFPHTGHVYDVAVIGAGLAGSELAWHLAQAGQDVLLVTQSLDSVGNLFHPTVQEEFPAGSLMQMSLEKSLPDRSLWVFHRNVKQTLELTPGIHLLQSCVTGLAHNDLFHLSTWEGPERLARKVVLAVGSFLDARLTIGQITEESGRLSEIAYGFLHQDLLDKGFEFSEVTQQSPETGEAVPYTVTFQTLSTSELEGFQLKRMPGLHALGRCVAGDHTYQSVTRDAMTLAEVLK
ncbi:FAD-dependent oxidoreductase [Deinococcus cellulosilyticus]|uniref:MnmG N-terminal domain-containing protein n=1 Tax=Deinococcus cellulosilyticus (strain DSM 18568 / NBRC 106333 / KACC 11606 / 5516J-15) TaxID=1223518 RepID=A0A511MYY6_DEIC1|nr:FAD-dependent oxidoreductase [Deinococcus cellulosilyticus]GEM45805.1 hypothetical protein DC3_14400 [Deinococcus cellulosilyticus NBRC 106333 = KACC 11606]